MIRMLKPEDQKTVETLCAGSAFGCRIASTLVAYGIEYPFAQFWIHEIESRPVAVLCRLDDVITLQSWSQADMVELREMIQAVGPRVLCCDKSVAQVMGFSPKNCGKILTRPARFPTGEQQEFIVSLRDLYNLCDQCSDPFFQPPAFEAFYLDASHRMRHQAAAAVGIQQDRLVSGAWILYSPTDALISSAAVHPDFLGRGLGKRTVFYALERMFPRRGFVLCNQVKNERFYQSVGFVPCGEWCEIMFGS